jgi:hypothetical protein
MPRIVMVISIDYRHKPEGLKNITVFATLALICLLRPY